MKQIYTIADYTGRKEIINPKYIERLIFAEISENRMMGDYSSSYYEQLYSVSIHLSSGVVIVLKFRTEKEALAEFNTLTEMMTQ